MAAAIQRTFIQPGHLVRIALTPELRWSTVGDIADLDGESWTGLDFSLGRIGPSGCTLTVNDADLAITSIAQSNRMSGARVRIYATDRHAIDLWQLDPGASAVPVVQLFDGLLDAPAIDLDRRILTMPVSLAGPQVFPRLTIGPQAGMHTLIPAGTTVQIGSQTYTVTRQ